MSITVAELVAKLKADTSDFDKNMKGAVDKTDDFGDKVEKSSGKLGVFAKAAIAGGVAAAGAFAVKAVMAASDMSESLSKVNVVFGNSADEIEAWSKNAASSMGISQQAALEATGTFGNLLTAMKFSQPEAKEMSTNFVQLASDLASFNNASPEDTLLALRAGLTGETEPLKKFGVNLNAARIEAEALRLGFKKVGTQFSAQAKAQASYNLILEDTKTAQGDFARTSDGLANRLRILKARAADFSAQVGAKLLPIVLKAWDAFDAGSRIIKDLMSQAMVPIGRFIDGTLKPAFDTVRGAAEQVFNVLFRGDFTGGPFQEDSPFVSALFTIRDWFQDMPQRMQPVIQLFQSIGQAVSENIGPVLQAAIDHIENFVKRGIDLAGKIADDFKVRFQIVKDIFTEVVSTIDEKTKDIQDIFGSLLNILRSTFDIAKQVVTAAFIVIGAAFVAGTAVIKEIWDRFGANIMSVIGNVIGGAVEVLRGIMKAIEGVFDVFAGIFTGDWSRVWNGLKAIFDGVWDSLVGIVRTALNLVKDAFNLAKSGLDAAFDAAFSGMKAIARGILNFVIGIFERGLNLATAPFRKGASIVNFFSSKVGLDVPDMFKDEVKLGRLDTGGIVQRPTVAALSANRRPEAVIPLDQFDSFMTGRGMGGSGGGTTIVLNVNGSIMTEREIVSALYDGLKQMQRYRGALLFADS